MLSNQYNNNGINLGSSQLIVPYSSKFSRHKSFVKHSKICEIINFRDKKFVIAAKFCEAWLGLIVAVVPCITTSLCLFLGCVFLLRCLFGWFCGQLRRWAACSLQLFCHTFVGRLASSIQKDGIRNERGPVVLGNTTFEGLMLDFLKQASRVVSLSKPGLMFSASHALLVKRPHPQKLNFRY